MPDGLIPPLLADDPSSAYPAYFDAQRKQMLAQMLMQNMQQSAQTPPQWDAMRLVPRRSILSGIAPILSGALAGRSINQAQQAEARYYGNLMGGGQQPQQQTAPAPLPMAPPADPNEVGPQPLIQRNGQTFAQVAQGTQQQPQAGLPNQGFGAWKASLDSSPAGRYMRFAQPGEYAKLVAEQSAKWNIPSDKVKEILAAHLPPDLENKALQNLALPTIGGERPGMPIRIAGKIVGYAPDPGAGVSYTVGANEQPVAHPIEGQKEIEAARAGAIKGEQERNTPRMIPKGGGVEELGYPPAPPSAGGQQPPSYFPQRSSQVPATPSQPQAPSGIWGQVPKLAIPNTPGQTTDTFHQKLLSDAAEKHKELVDQYGREADLADQKKQLNAQALAALPNAEVGPLSDWLTTNRARLIEAGVPKNLIPESGTVTPTLELNKYLKNAALQGARLVYGPRMTQTEVKLQTDEMSASTHMMADAIASLIRQDDFKNDYAKQRAQDYDKYIENRGDPLRFEQWYSNKFSLSRFVSRQMTPGAAIERLKQKPELAKDFQNKYGWAPYAGE